jgi:hypothetical protein
MLALFSQRRSAELCNKSWEIALTVCLTEDAAEMDQGVAHLWTRAFLEALRDERPEVREAAADSLSLGLQKDGFTPDIMAALFERLRDQVQAVRFCCAHLLARAGEAALPYIFGALTIRNSKTGETSIGSNESGIWESLSVIDGVLSDADVGADTRAACAGIVGQFLSARNARDGADSMDIWKAGDTLGEHIGGDAALRQLLGLLEHSDPRVRTSVAHGLSHIDDSQASRALGILSRDPDESVRTEALRYLNKP